VGGVLLCAVAFLFFELPANTSMAFSIPLVLLRAYMSPEDKEKYSNAVPQSFDEIMCGVMLGDFRTKSCVELCCENIP